jgi:LysM repeat protein
MEHATFDRMNTAGAGSLPKWGLFTALVCMALACTRSASTIEGVLDSPIAPIPYSSDPAVPPVAAQPATATQPFPTETEDAGPTAYQTPTLDPTRVYHSPTSGPGTYTVQSGDTMGAIAVRLGISVEALMAANPTADPNMLEIGQVLSLPLPPSDEPGPNFKIVPDSELVFSPTAHGFTTAEYLKTRRTGYLVNYREVVEGKDRSGAEIVDFVAWHYSVNPRLILAVLEFQSGWVSKADPGEEKKVWPFLYIEGKSYLYKQLAWAADQLNTGYYQWKAGGGEYWFLADGSQVRSGSGINAGTAGVQDLMGQLYALEDWKYAVSQNGVYATYESMFGNPFAWTLEPIVPEGLVQPALILPFEPGVLWYFTSGPHGGWGSGSAFAALDFGPGDVDAGCLRSEEWVTAAAPGLVVRSEDGMVVVDLDFDGNEQTNWVLFYGHIETRDRVPFGTKLETGQRIGHASCEGGVFTGTHVHFARRFNGEWIAADGPIPLILDGWAAVDGDREYNGYLTRNGVTDNIVHIRR